MLARMSGARAGAIILAAGVGRRLGADIPKAFLPIGERTILSVATAAAGACPLVGDVVIAVPPGYEELAREQVARTGASTVVVTGGTTRRASVHAALMALPDVEVVAVHDAARPFASPDLFTSVIEAVVDGVDGAIPLVPIADTVKRIDGERVVATLDRDELGLAQTPQAFRFVALRLAHERAEASGEDATDDAKLVEREGVVVVVRGDPDNVKITTMRDLALAQIRMGGADD